MSDILILTKKLNEACVDLKINDIKKLHKEYRKEFGDDLFRMAYGNYILNKNAQSICDIATELTKFTDNLIG